MNTNNPPTPRESHPEHSLHHEVVHEAHGDAACAPEGDPVAQACEELAALLMDKLTVLLRAVADGYATTN